MRCLALVLLALVSPVAGLAEDGTRVRLLEGWREPGSGPHVAAIEIALAPGWYTYWRVPGAAGIAPSFDWTGSRNLGAARIEWPTPSVFDSFGVRTIGYHDGVVLPVLLTPEAPGQPIEVSLTLSFGVCRDICIPREALVTGRLTAGGVGDDAAALAAGLSRLDATGDAAADRQAIEAALARRAHSAAEAGVLDVTCRLAPADEGLALTATVTLARAPAEAQTAVVEAVARPDLWIGEATAETRGTVVTAEARLESPGATIDRSALRVSLIDADRTVDIRGCRAPD
jgi:DsbC/DsbD-like thiol-disulfide interchange protein